MHHHVRVLFQHFFGVRGNRHAPRRVRRADDFAKVASDFCRIRINGANNFNGLFFPHQFRDGCADRADTILDGANFLFHVVLRFPFECAHHAHFWFQRKPLR